MPENPHHLKNQIVSEGMQNANIHFGELRNDPFTAISVLGDPMMPAVAGIVNGIINYGGKVMLAGGTQMCSIIAILKSLKCPLNGLCIGTTSYVADDPSSDLVNLLKQLTNDVPIYTTDLHMMESSKLGLQAFAKGFVKEGVGAGGISIMAIVKSKGQIHGNILLRAIEDEYIKVLMEVM
jgi:NaMN:DMB phosphoribosyltransferase